MEARVKKYYLWGVERMEKKEKEMEKAQVGKWKVVRVLYKLEVGEAGSEREEMVSSKEEEFIWGCGELLEGFEQGLKGLSAGDKFAFSVSKESGYGEYETEKVVEVPRSSFEIRGKFDESIVKEDAMLPMYDGEGHRVEGLVVSVGDEVVVMDFNHPLAGEELHYSGEVLGVREASVEELAGLVNRSEKECGCGGCGGGCGEGGCH